MIDAITTGELHELEFNPKMCASFFPIELSASGIQGFFEPPPPGFDRVENFQNGEIFP
jgi:hypothetical protein